VAVSGLGVAAFHPEGARYANYVSRGRAGARMSHVLARRQRGLRAGPLLMTPAVLAFGLHGTLLALIPLWLGAGAAAGGAGAAADVRSRAAGPRSVTGNGATIPDLIGPFARLGSVVGPAVSVVFLRACRRSLPGPTSRTGSGRARRPATRRCP
jgi:FSR family fosmidomycin resistance protein-like MFS transporter